MESAMVVRMTFERSGVFETGENGNKEDRLGDERL